MSDVIERRLFQCGPENLCKDCEGMRLRQRLAREEDWDTATYSKAIENDQLTWTDQDRLDIALAHPPMKNNATTLPVYDMFLGFCGRWGCRVCSMELCRLAERLISEINEEDHG